ncbi:hypothetical protein SBOR_8575 [Sclerotinia borealis F-4128]|uniref:Uncharacterized protein n=1 Tax=Sclerotinia borealis (strain F-4128) TaxID=1432307 RepID=W9C5M6_SCLBF|nr:hypothetical protein SBOR_8575 [Sclerotinia borealis F-4128]
MSSPEEIKAALARELNQLRKLYGFQTSIYFTSPSRKEVILRLSREEENDPGLTANISLTGGCFAIRSCPVFKSRVGLLGRRESKIQLSSQVINWFKNNRAKFPMTYKEEQQYIDLKARMRLVHTQEHQFAYELEAFINNEVESRQHLASQKKAGSVVSGMKPDSPSITKDMAQLKLNTSSHNKRGAKRARDQDTEMGGDDDNIEVPRKLSKQAKRRATKRERALAALADAQVQLAL